MRAIFLLSLLLATSCAWALTGCSSGHPGPRAAGTDGALPEESSAAKSTPGATSRTSDQPLALEPVSPSGNASSAPAKSSAKAKPDLVSEMAGTDDDPPPMASQNDSGGRGGINAGTDGDNIEVVDESLNGQLAVVRVGSETTTNNLLAVFAGLRNKTTQKLFLEVQTIYKDKDGNSLNAGSWVPMTLKPHQETEYRSASLTEDATDYLVRVRRAP